MPPAAPIGEGTPPSTAAVLGQIAGIPRRVHQMAGVVLGALIGQGGKPVAPPTLVTAYDYTPSRRGRRRPGAEAAADDRAQQSHQARRAWPLLKTLLEAPLCYTSGGTSARHAEELQPVVRGAPRPTAAALRQDRHAGRRSIPTPPSIPGSPVACSSRTARPIPMSCWSAPARPAARGRRSCMRRRSRRRCSRCSCADLALHSKSNAKPHLLPPKPVPAPVASVRDDLPALAGAVL